MLEGKSPIRVLLANENIFARSGMRMALERSADFEVIAESGDDAETLELIRQLEPDVAVLDVQMHHLLGVAVLRAARSNHWPVAVVFSTAIDDDPNRIALLKMGANGAALQAAGPEDMRAAVRQAHLGRNPLNAGALARLVAQVSHLDLYAEIAALSEADVELLSLLGMGLTDRRIARRLGLNTAAVRRQTKRIFATLQVGNRTEAVSRALSMGVLQRALPGSPAYVAYQN